MNSQAQILEMIRNRRRVTTAEILREVACTTPAKAILRLRRAGWPIENISKPGELAVYEWQEGQLKLL